MKSLVKISVRVFGNEMQYARVEFLPSINVDDFRSNISSVERAQYE